MAAVVVTASGAGRYFSVQGISSAGGSPTSSTIFSQTFLDSLYFSSSPQEGLFGIWGDGAAGADVSSGGGGEIFGRGGSVDSMTNRLAS